MARPVAALRGRAKAGLQSRRRRSMLMRIIGFGRSKVFEVDLRLVGDAVKGLAVLVDLELEVIVGVRLAGVEINHLIKRENIDAFAGAVFSSDEPVRKELKIRWRGCRRFE